MTGTFLDSSGRAVHMGGQVGRGGEGAIFEVPAAPGTVAKIYHALPNAATEAKLRATVALSRPDLRRLAAWPNDLLRDPVTRRVCGVLMPRAAGRELHHLMDGRERREFFPSADWAFLVHAARNVAAAVETVHNAGIVIGDLNQRGLLVSGDATVRLIDCDSFQVRDAAGVIHRCGVGVPEYTPPELQGVRLADVDRTAAHDHFGLAALIFQLLCLGRHPFVGIWRGAGEGPQGIGEWVKRGLFAYSRRAVATDVGPPPHAVGLGSVGPAGDLFERAFAGPPAVRPTAGEWRAALEELRRSMKTCGLEKAHRFPRAFGACPWCAIERAGGTVYFASPGRWLDYDDGFDLAAFWRRVNALPPMPRFPPTLRPAAAPPVRAGRPVPAEAEFRRLGPLGTVPSTPAAPAYERLPLLPAYHDPPPPPPPDYETPPPEPLPALQVPPPEPVLTLRPDPTPPRMLSVSDPKVEARRPLRALWRAADYRTVKWGTLAAAGVCLPHAAAAVVWHGAAGDAYATAVGASSGLLAAIFGGTWWAFRRPIQKFYRTRLTAARAWATPRVAENRRRSQLYAAAAEQVRRKNEEARRRWEAAHADWERQRDAVQAENQRRRATHEPTRRAWEAAVLAMAGRNAALRISWEAEWAAVIADATARWRSEHARAQGQRAAIEDRNTRLRLDWKRRLQYEAERARRVEALKRAQERLDELTAGSSWSSRLFKDQRRDTQCEDQLKDLAKQLSAGRLAFERARAGLLPVGRNEALQRFLRGNDLSRARLPGIGEGRKAALATHGIRTAADIEVIRLASIKSLGPVTVDALLQWRRGIEESFVLPPAVKPDATTIRRLLDQHRPARDRIRQRMRSFEAERHAIRDRLRTDFEAAQRKADAAALEEAQCRADLAMMPPT